MFALTQQTDYVFDFRNLMEGSFFRLMLQDKTNNFEESDVTFWKYTIPELFGFKCFIYSHVSNQTACFFSFSALLYLNLHPLNLLDIKRFLNLKMRQTFVNKLDNFC